MNTFYVALSSCLALVSCETPYKKKRPVSSSVSKPPPKPVSVWKINYKKNEFNELTRYPESITNSLGVAKLHVNLLSTMEEFEERLLELPISMQLELSALRKKDNPNIKDMIFGNYIGVVGSRSVSRQLVTVLIMGPRKKTIMMADNPAIAIRTHQGVIRLRGVKGEQTTRNVGVVHIVGAGARKVISIMRRSAYLETSFEGVNEYYVISINCHGFADAWRKTGWLLNKEHQR